MRPGQNHLMNLKSVHRRVLYSFTLIIRSYMMFFLFHQNNMFSVLYKCNNMFSVLHKCIVSVLDKYGQRALALLEMRPIQFSWSLVGCLA